MAIQEVNITGSGLAAGAGSASFTASIGTPAQGNVLVAIVQARQGSGTITITAPTGWNILGQQGSASTVAIVHATCVVGASQPSSTFGGGTASSTDWDAVVAEFSGVNTTTPVNAHVLSSKTTSTSLTCAAQTPTAYNVMIVGTGTNTANQIATLTNSAGLTYTSANGTSETNNRVTMGYVLYSPPSLTAISNTAASATGTNATSGIILLNPAATSNTQNLSGALSFSGKQNRNIVSNHFASSSFVGKLTKNITSKHSGTLHFSGIINKKITSKHFGILRFGGNLTTTHSGGHQYIKNLSSALNFIGTVTKHTTSKHSGSISFTTNIKKNIKSTKLGNLSFSTKLTKHTSKKYTGALNFVGTVNKHIYSVYLSNLSFSGTIKKNTNKKLSASVSFIGHIVAIRPIIRIVQVIVQLNRSFKSSVNLSRTILNNDYLTRIVTTSMNYKGS